MALPGYWPNWANYYASTTIQPGTYFQNEPTLTDANVWVDYMDGMVQETRIRQLWGEPNIVCRPLGYKKPLTRIQRFLKWLGLKMN